MKIQPLTFSFCSDYLLTLGNLGKVGISTLSKIGIVAFSILKKIGSLDFFSHHFYTALNFSKKTAVSILSITPISLDIFKKILILYPIKFYYSKIFFITQKLASDCSIIYELTQKISVLSSPFSNEKIDSYALKKSIRNALQDTCPQLLQIQIALAMQRIFERVTAHENTSIEQTNEFIHTDKTIRNIIRQVSLNAPSTTAKQKTTPLNRNTFRPKAIDENSEMPPESDSQLELLINKIHAQEIRHTSFQTIALVCSTLSTVARIPKILKNWSILDLGTLALSSGKTLFLSHILQTSIPVFKGIEILGLCISTLDNAYLVAKYLHQRYYADTSEDKSESLHYLAKAFTELLQYGFLLASTLAIAILGAFCPSAIILAIISKSVDLIILLVKYKLPSLPSLTKIYIPQSIA